MARGNPHPSYSIPKGVSGNPGGRPKSRRITEAYNRLLSKPKGELLRVVRSRTIPMEEILAAETILRARRETRAVIEVTDRVQGKEPQAHELGGTEGERLVDENKVASRVAQLMLKAKGRK